MKDIKKRIIYLVITLAFLILTLVILNVTNLSNSVELSKAIQIILILFLIRIAFGCTLYIKEQYSTKQYSYEIVMNLGLLLFMIVNVLRQIDLLIENWNVNNIMIIYANTLVSFSYFAMLILPCIIILSLYSIVANIFLIKKEGFSSKKLLGVLLGILSMIGLFSGQVLYYIFTKIFIYGEVQTIRYTLNICINATLSYFYTLIVANLYCNIMAARHIPKYDKDFVIILGSKIREDGTLTPLLRGRVDKAIEFGNKQYEKTKKKIIYVPSGGKGNDEIMPEAEAIRNYLLEKNIKEKQIIIENKSVSTRENMRFSNDIIKSLKKYPKICFSTTNYHVFRSGVLANEQGIICEGMGSKTKWYFYCNALIREFIASIVQEKKSHIILLIIINFSLIVLILIGKYFNLII